MRILTFTSLFPNSLAPNHGIFLLQRTAHLANREGNHVEVVAPLPYVPKFLRNTAPGRFAAVAEVETIGGLRVHHPRYALLPKVSMPLHGWLMYAGSIGLVRALHREHHFDCVDAHYVFPDGVAAVLMARSLGIPVTLTARGTDIHTFPKFLTIRPQIRWALRHADAVGAVSNSLARTMRELEAELSQVEVIGNGVDTARFFPEDRASARRKIGIAAEDKMILCVAALRKVKGIDILIRAVALLKKDVVNLKVVFVGRGEELSSLQRMAAQLECDEVCKFVGPVPNEELRHYYSAADITCLPSRKEGWPNVVLESLACGTPVVGTAVGAVPEILSNKRHGIVVTPSAVSIYSGIREAFAREWDPRSIVSFAQTKTWDNVAENVESLLIRCTPPCGAPLLQVHCGKSR